MRILSIANHKGGVGKTATAYNLGVILSREGIRVLLVDMDPQASLSSSARVLETSSGSMAEVIGGSEEGSKDLPGVILEISSTLSIAPADISLSGSELGLSARWGREGILRDLLRSKDLPFDLVIVDTPPSLGLLTVNALVAADAVIIPTQPLGIDLRGLRSFLETIEQIRERLNPDLELLGVLVTFYDRRLIHHQEAVEAMSRAGVPLLEDRIGRSVRVAEAMSAGESVITYEPKNPQAERYLSLGRRVGQWLRSGRI